MVAESRPLTHCPVCRYDLTGLPRNYRCPECGFEYDGTTLVWRTPIIPRALLLVGWLLVYAVAQHRCDVLLIRGLGFHPRDATLIVLFLSAVLPFVGLFHPSGLIIVGARGVTFRFPLGSFHFVPWRQFRVEPTRLDLYQGTGCSEHSLVLPATGLSWRRRRRLHAVIAERWRTNYPMNGERARHNDTSPGGADTA